MSALAIGGLVGLSLAMAAPALAMPVDVGSAQDTVNRLESEGYRVILNKVGAAPLDHCMVTAVRPGRDVTTRVNELGAGDTTREEVLYTTVYVDAKC